MKYLIKVLSLTISLLMSLEVMSQSDPREEFVKYLVKEHPDIGHCVAKGMYDVLNDAEKGLFQIGIDFIKSAPENDDDVTANFLSNMYDRDKEFKKSIELKWKNSMESIRNKCKI